MRPRPDGLQPVFPMAQYIYTMIGVSKTVPPNRTIIKDISLSFFPGAKIGLLGLNGAGKSTVLRIMAGVDHEHDGEARPQPGIRIGYLPQDPRTANMEQSARERILGLAGRRALEEVDGVYEEFDGQNATRASIRSSLIRRFDVESVSVISARDVSVTAVDKGFEVSAQYDHTTPFISNISFTVSFNKTRVIRR